MKKNVLVFPCGSEIGLELYRSLSYSTNFSLIGGSSVEDHGSYVYSRYITGLPFVEAHDFIEKINTVVKQYQIDYIFPAHDSVVVKLAQAKLTGNIDCEIITSPADTCELLRSKGRTYDCFSDAMHVPRIYKSLQDISEEDWPVFLKPDTGQGSKGTHLVSSLKEAEVYTAADNSLLILENLPGKEYTVDCFTNRHGELLFCEARQRQRILNGISVNSVIVRDKQFKELANIINNKLKLNGVWFFQLKENKADELVLMEISPRVAGTMGLTRCMGVNLPLLSLFNAQGYDIDIIENDYSITIDRALENKYKHDIKYSHVYLDFDDLVVFEEYVNPNIIAFVYQCFNKNIKVHLLTKHKDDLRATLQKYHLTGVFDDLTQIPKTDNKYAYISEKEAIFIDDSFAERKQVHEVCHIPVFDSHMLEALMD
jgi:hypothetical protein